MPLLQRKGTGTPEGRLYTVRSLSAVQGNRIHRSEGSEMNGMIGERVSVYIDIENIRKGLEMINVNLEVDFKELVDQLVGDRIFVAAYVFDACNGSESKMRRLRRVTKNPGFRPVILPYYAHREEQGLEQKGVDVKLALMMVDEAEKDRFDTAILLSGDADYIPAIELTQAAGKKVEMAAFGISAGEDVRCAADLFTEIDSMNVICMKAAPVKVPAYPQPKAGEVTV